MTEDRKTNQNVHETNDKLFSWLLFILVAGVIVCALVFFVSDLVKSPKVQDVVIKVEIPDSTRVAPQSMRLYNADEIDSLIVMVSDYEKNLDEKYQYLLENRQEDDRFKTWGALIVGVIVSICGFWGYKSMKDLREDITSSTEKTSELTVNAYLDKNLQDKVNDALTHSLRTDIVEIIKTNVFDTLNSAEDPIVKAKVAEKIESEEFEKKLSKIVKEEIVKVFDEMTQSFRTVKTSEEQQLSSGDDDIQLT